MQLNMTNAPPYVSPFRTLTNLTGACYYYSMSVYCMMKEWWTENALKESEATTITSPEMSEQQHCTNPFNNGSTTPVQQHAPHFVSPLRRRGLICSTVGTLCLTRGLFDHLLDSMPVACLILDLVEIGIVTLLLTWDVMYSHMPLGTLFKIGSWFWTSFFISALGVTSPVPKLDTRILQVAMGGVSLITYVQLLFQAHECTTTVQLSVPTAANNSTSKTVTTWRKMRVLAFRRFMVYALSSCVYIVTWAIGPNCAGIVTRLWHIELCRLVFHIPLLTVATWLAVCSNTDACCK